MALSAAGLSGLRTWTSRIVAAATLTTTVVLVQTPALAERLHLRPLDGDDWLLAGTVASVPVVAAVAALRRLGRR